jgi:hypothetical protein
MAVTMCLTLPDPLAAVVAQVLWEVRPLEQVSLVVEAMALPTQSQDLVSHMQVAAVVAYLRQEPQALEELAEAAMGRH